MEKSKKDTPEKQSQHGVLVVPGQIPQEIWLWEVQIYQKEYIKNLLNRLASGINGAIAFPGKLWQQHYDTACHIFKEAANVAIKLPTVPTGSDTTKSFERLRDWISKSLRKISQPQKQPPVIAGSKKGEELTTTAKQIEQARQRVQSDGGELNWVSSDVAEECMGKSRSTIRRNSKLEGSIIRVKRRGGKPQSPLLYCWQDMTKIWTPVKTPAFAAKPVPMGGMNLLKPIT